MHNCFYSIVTERNMCRYQYAIRHCFCLGDSRQASPLQGGWLVILVGTSCRTQTSAAAGKVRGAVCTHSLAPCPQLQACSKGNANLRMANKEKPLPNTVCIQYSKYVCVCI